MKQEFLARLVLVASLVSVAVISLSRVLFTQINPHASYVQLSASMPENGGWSLDTIYAQVDVPLHIEMVSQDVVHGFTVGQMEGEDVELYPGIPKSTTLLFEQPGIYTYYCTRWCGPNHWRMRGTIEVAGENSPDSAAPPRYVHLEIDIDAPHPAEFTPVGIPSFQRGANWKNDLPFYAFTEKTYWQNSPSELWSLFRQESTLAYMSDSDIWDAVDWIWSQQTTKDALDYAQQTYNQECAACHGETGTGKGVIVRDMMPFSYDHGEFGHALMQPPDLSDPAHILGAPPALLEGKIVRGGMGTGMPLYGSIYTQQEIDALVNYLYTFFFQRGDSYE